MMSIKYFNILITIFVLFRYNCATRPVESSLNKKAAVKFRGGNIDSGIETVDRASTECSDSCFQNYEFLDPQNIETTRQKVLHCNHVSMSCESAKQSKFRTIDGSCNNLANPGWGKSNTCFIRILPFDYADKKSVPRNTSCKGQPLPNARHISNVFHIERNLEYDPFTTHFMEWGQMLGHDFGLSDRIKTPESDYNFPIECCKDGPVIDDECLSIPVSPSDPFYSQHNVTCLDFQRTVPCNCTGNIRFHLNKNTAFIDASILYGSTESASKKLRSFSSGMMKVEYNNKSGPMLPTVPVESQCISPSDKPACYHSGDIRTDHTLFLLTVQTYLLRYHNFICGKLKEINPHWDDERLFQEARRIVIAVVQYITYKYYLPHVLGEEIMLKEGLQILPGCLYTKYNPDVNPSVTDEFSTFAGRYGHTQIPPRFSEVDPETGKNDSLMVRDYYFNPFGFCCGQYDKISIGMSKDNPKKRDVSLSDEVRNYLYKLPNMNFTAGQDLAALSILRGRDHGLPGYTYYLTYLLKIEIHEFDDLKCLMPDESVELLKILYCSVHDIDVYSGAFAENPVPGGFVGPTIAAVVARQYNWARNGDRFWFEHGDEAGSFTKSQLCEIKESSFARFLCDTAKFSKIQENPFFPPSLKNRMRSCKNIRQINFFAWKERHGKYM